MKMQQTLLLFLFGSLLPLVSAEVDYGDYARLLDRSVEPEGVRYQAWADHVADRQR